MYQLAIEKIKTAIFPIFYNIAQGTSSQIGVSGTGFFIDNQGHFITALHVITEAPPMSTFNFRGNIPDHVTNPPLEVFEFYRDAKRDIFLGKININNSSFVRISADKPKVGKSVCLCGYPLAQLSTNSDYALNVSAVRQYWQPTFIIDNMHVADNVKNYQGFLTQDISLNGMSGGPVFDTEGVVYGVNTAFFHREIPQANKSAIQVFNGIVLENSYIKDVYEMVQVTV